MRITFAVTVLLSACLVAQSLTGQHQWPTKGWPSATPNDVGLDLKVLNELDADITAGKYGNIDSMLIIRHGKIAIDRAYKHDYD